MKVFKQLVLTLDGSEIKIQLNASNDGGLSLKTPINRIENNSGSSSASAPFDSTLNWPKKLEPSESWYQSGNDPVYDLDLDLGTLLTSSQPPNGRWPNLDLSLDEELGALNNRILAEFKLWIGGERFHRYRFQAGLDALLANLYRNHNDCRQLLIRMGNTNYCHRKSNGRRINNATLVKLVGFLRAHGYIHFIQGKADQFSKVTSWCCASALLIAFLEQSKATVRLAEGVPLAVIRQRPTKLYSSDGIVQKESGAVIQLPASSRENVRLKKAEESLIGYTETWCNHTTTLDGKYVVPWLTRIFILNTSLGGRFYGDYQNLPKVDRDRILIDGEQTVELDFKSLHYAMMYAQAGIQLKDDPYIVDGYSRQAIKQVSLVLANTSCLRALKSHITLSGNPEHQKTFSAVKHNLAVYKESRARGLKCHKPYVPPWYHNFIEGLPVGVRGEELINALKNRHPEIADRFGETDIGLKLQNLDSQILAHALKLLSSIPLLPVHDSIRCRVSDAERVREAMLEAGKVILGVTLVVTTD